MPRSKAPSSSAAASAPAEDAKPSRSASPDSNVLCAPWSHPEERARLIEAIEGKWKKDIHLRLRHRDISDAQRADLFQDVLTELAKQYRRLDGPEGQVKTFVKRTADNYRRNHLRKHGLPVDDGFKVEWHPDASPNPETTLQGTVALEKFEGYVDRLPPDEKQVFQAHRAGITLQVTASLMKLSYTEVQGLLKSAQKRLRAMVRGSKRGAAIATEVLGAKVVQKK